MVLSRTVRDEAHYYAARGWHVVPIRPGEKRPAVSDWVNAATVDHEFIDEWWTTNPDHGIGIVTGERSNIWVLDVDVDHGGDDTLADLEHQHGPLPDTIETITGSGGRHIIFTWPGWNPGTNAGRLGPGLDIRAEGGQIVAPPTIHPNGQPYAWELEHDPHDGLNTADAPDWLLDLCKPAQPIEPRRDVAKYEGEPRPGDKFAATIAWPELLERDGATCIGQRVDRRTGHAYELWARPGKNARDGGSASLYYAGTDLLKIFTTNWPGLTEGQTYTRFGYLAATRYHGDHTAAARALADVEGDAARVQAWIAQLPQLEQAITTGTNDEPAETLADRIRARIYTYNTLADLPAPTWLVDGWLVNDSLALLHGPPGHGKSFVAVDWACSIATGTPWHHKGITQGDVLYVLAEGTAGIRQRLHAWATAHDGLIPNALHVHPYAIDIADTAWSTALAEVAHDLQPRLVIVDTLARNMLTGDENATRDMGIFIAGLDRIRQATGACILTVHHQARAGNIRGAIALEAAMDTIVQCTQDGTTLTLKMIPPAGKQKDAEPALDLALTRANFASSCALTDYQPSTELSPAMVEMLAILDDLDVSRIGVSGPVWHGETDLQKATFYRHLKRLTESQHCLNVGSEKNARYTLTDQGQRVAMFHRSLTVSPQSHDSLTTAGQGQSQVSPPPLGGGTETVRPTESGNGHKQLSAEDLL